jgi:hypothetical protein
MPPQPSPELLTGLFDLLKSQGIDPGSLYPPPPPALAMPEHVRSWFARRSEEDIARLDRILREFDDEQIEKIGRAIKFADDSATVGKFAKWLGLSILAFFIGAVTLGEKIAIAWKWIMGAPR